MPGRRSWLPGSRGVLAALIALGLSAAAPAQPPSREDQIKAGYLFNFIKFVDWPPSDPNDRLVICFRGGTGIHRALATDLDSKRVGGRRLALRILQDGEGTTGCSVLYVAAEEAQSRRFTLDLSHGPMLTVGDDRNFTREGGMIALFTDNNRLKFVVNVSNAQRAGMRISSSLLQLASSVERPER